MLKRIRGRVTLEQEKVKGAERERQKEVLNGEHWGGSESSNKNDRCWGKIGACALEKMEGSEEEEGRVTFKGIDHFQAHSCLCRSGYPYDDSPPQWTWWLQGIMPCCACASECVSVSLCVALPRHTHIRTNTPVLPKPVIWLSSKPATTGEDNSFVSCCRHVTIPHPILSQVAGREGGEKGSQSFTVSRCYPSLSYSSCLFLSLRVFFFPGFSHCVAHFPSLYHVVP